MQFETKGISAEEIKKLKDMKLQFNQKKWNFY